MSAPSSWLSRRREAAREEKVPKVGELAPDFVADVLGANELGAGQHRTGEQVRLSELQGRPVGLVFGSYT